jgi:hypothetical protein
MATVRLDVSTAAVLERLAARRGTTKSEVLRDAIARLDEEEAEDSSAYHRLRPFVGVVDSGGKQLSTGTGRRLRQLLEERHARRAG